MTTRVLLLVGTRKGAFIAESDAGRREWALRGPFCEGWPVHDMSVDPATGVILVKGGVPGPKGAWVEVRDAVKRALPKEAHYTEALVKAGEEAQAIVHEEPEA